MELTIIDHIERCEMLWRIEDDYINPRIANLCNPCRKNTNEGSNEII